MNKYEKHQLIVQNATEMVAFYDNCRSKKKTAKHFGFGSIGSVDAALVERGRFSEVTPWYLKFKRLPLPEGVSIQHKKGRRGSKRAIEDKDHKMWVSLAESGKAQEIIYESIVHLIESVGTLRSENYRLQKELTIMTEKCCSMEKSLTKTYLELSGTKKENNRLLVNAAAKAFATPGD